MVHRCQIYVFMYVLQILDELAGLWAYKIILMDIYDLKEKNDMYFRRLLSALFKMKFPVFTA